MSEANEEKSESIVISDQNLERGAVQISEDVFAAIIRKFTLEVPQVIRFASNTVVGGLVEMFGKKSGDRPVKVVINDDCVEVTVNVIIEFGANIRDVAQAIQKVITEKIENITGHPVAKVDVVVSDLSDMPSPDEEIVQPIEE